MIDRTRAPPPFNQLAPQRPVPSVGEQVTRRTCAAGRPAPPSARPNKWPSPFISRARSRPTSQNNGPARAGRPAPRVHSSRPARPRAGATNSNGEPFTSLRGAARQRRLVNWPPGRARRTARSSWSAPCGRQLIELPASQSACQMRAAWRPAARQRVEWRERPIGVVLAEREIGTADRAIS
jgi:hypothetical protein